MDKLIPFAQLLADELRDPGFRAEWERLAPARAVANWLVGYRTEHGLTLTALARLSGMSYRTAVGLECGDSLPSPRTLRKLSESLAIGIPADLMRKKEPGHD